MDEMGSGRAMVQVKTLCWMKCRDCFLPADLGWLCPERLAVTMSESDEPEPGFPSRVPAYSVISDLSLFQSRDFCWAAVASLWPLWTEGQMNKLLHGDCSLTIRGGFWETRLLSLCVLVQTRVDSGERQPSQRIGWVGVGNNVSWCVNWCQLFCPNPYLQYWSPWLYRLGSREGTWWTFAVVQKGVSWQPRFFL